MRGRWEAEALCARVGGDAWFPDDDSRGENRRRAEYAAAVCRELCPVRVQCLELALVLEEGRGPGSRFGVWGGMTPGERVVVAQTRAAMTVVEAA